MERAIYLDSNATAPLRPEARAAMLAALASGGNASSVHRAGRAARAHVEEAREAVARLVGAVPGDVVFTASGTEANVLALGAPAEDDRPLLVSAVEHPSVLAGGRWPQSRIERIRVDRDGVVDLDWLAARLGRDPRPALVSVMAANNETGVIQPVARIAELARGEGVPVHCDAVQACGRIAADLEALGADFVTVSSHKLGGPLGAGAVVRRRGAPALVPVIRGGGQERGLRAGTENVPAIAGFGAACAIAAEEMARNSDILTLRDWLEGEIHTISAGAVIFGEAVPRLPNTTCVAVPGSSAETLLIALDLAGVAVSAGSACSSGKVGTSHVLAAMGVEASLAKAALRISLGWATTRAEVEKFIEIWRDQRRRHGGGHSAEAA